MDDRVGNTRSTCIFCGAPLAPHLRRPRHVAAVRELRRRRSSSTAWSRSTRCTSTSASECFLVQLEEYVSPEEIFTEYAYFSSYSDSWLEHMRRYAETHDRTGSGSGSDSLVVEVASNDGYLLQYFVREGHPGARHRAGGQRRRGGASRRASRRWWSSSARRRRASWSREGRQADLIAGHNVLAQVPDLNDFVAGLQILLEPDGVVHDRVPAPRAADRGEPVRHHLPRALLVLLAPRGGARSSPRTGSTLFDVEELPTHGGSLRVYARHARRRHEARSPSARASSGSARATPGCCGSRPTPASPSG